MYEGSAVVVKIPICAGNESPQVVDAVDAIVGGLEKARWEGCPSMGRKSAWAAASAEVFALGVMVAGWGNRGGLPFLKTRNIY